MAITFEQVWHAVLAHVPSAGPLLCREWVQWAYNEYGTAWAWGDLRVESRITVNNQKTGTCTVTQGNATVAGGTLTFAATDVGRQFRLGSIPVYTIIAVNPAGGTTATLDQVYSEAGGVVTGYVLDAYVTLPIDFERFYAILDPNNKWRIRFWLSADLVNRLDPGRMSTSNACMVINQTYSPVPANLGQPRFELFPFQTAFRAYPMWYYKKPPILGDDDILIGQLGNRAKDILSEGALSRAALWPGTEGHKNPYFNLQLAAAHEAKFRQKIDQAEVKDDDLYFESCPIAEYPYAPFPWDAAYLQAHEPLVVG